jgi:Ca2+-binding RTX toxin-like protein
MPQIAGTTGADVLIGTALSDTYTINNLGDTISPDPGGFDTVFAFLSFTLGDGLENLVLLGTGNINATGNSLSNALQGNSGNNILAGGGGMDVLLGGAGADKFRFNELGWMHADQILDFNALEGDQIVLTSAITGLPAGTPLAYYVNRPTKDRTPGVVRQPGGVGLAFDPDGIGPAKAILFATVSPYAVLDARSFAVV